MTVTVADFLAAYGYRSPTDTDPRRAIVAGMARYYDLSYPGDDGGGGEAPASGFGSGGYGEGPYGGSSGPEREPDNE